MYIHDTGHAPLMLHVLLFFSCTISSSPNIIYSSINSYEEWRCIDALLRRKKDRDIKMPCQ